MKTDASLYQIFRQLTAQLFEIMGEPHPGPCVFKSVVMKDISRTMDGLVIPENPLLPLWIVEVQMFKDLIIYMRTGIEHASVQIEYLPREVRSVIIFGSADLDPQTQPWVGFIKVVYLDKYLEDLEAEDPEHLLVALFRPLYAKQNSEVEKWASHDYGILKSVAATDPNCKDLPEIFKQWLVQRFKQLSLNQINSMMIELTPIEDTVAGKELIDIGIVRGMERGMERGREEGREEGMETILVRLIQRRFGNGEFMWEPRVRGLHVDKLAALGDALLDAATAEELDSWLTAQGARRSGS